MESLKQCDQLHLTRKDLGSNPFVDKSLNNLNVQLTVDKTKINEKRQGMAPLNQRRLFCFFNFESFFEWGLLSTFYH